MQRMIDDDLYWVTLYSRAVMPENWYEYKRVLFHVLPPIIRDIVVPIIRRHLQSELYGQGMSRHTESEVFDLGKRDLISLSDFLGDKPFFMGDDPTILDATAFGLLANVFWCPINSPLKERQALATRPTIIADRWRCEGAAFSGLASLRIEFTGAMELSKCLPVSGR